MMNKVEEFRLLRGYTVEAQYNPDPDFPEFAGHPLIEAMPPYEDNLDNIEKRLIVRPQYRSEDRDLSCAKRLVKLEHAKRFFQPLGKSINLAISMDILMRWGYVDRNPLTPAHIKKILSRPSLDYKELSSLTDNSGITTSGITLLGYSGIGKTRTINRILSSYPQVIKHTQYGGRGFTSSQILWLKIDCPVNGTIRGLCISFFRAVDNILGLKDKESFYYLYVKPQKNSSDLLEDMIAVACQHHIGLFVIDEIQNLHGTVEGQITINFLRRLSNELGIALCFVGTPRAERTLTKNFSVARRGSATGNEPWTGLKLGNQQNPDDFNVFITALWKYRYLQTEQELTWNLVQRFYDVTLGITDLAVKIFIAAQRRVLLAKMSDPSIPEKITPKLVSVVAKEEFPWLTEAINSLKKGTPESLRKYEDLYFEYVKLPEKNFAQTDESYAGVSVVFDRSGEPLRSPQESSPSTNVAPIQASQDTTPNPSPKRSKSSQQYELTKVELIQIVRDGIQKHQAAYTSLENAGLVVNLDEYT